MRSAVAVTGLGLEVPGIDSPAALLPPAPLAWDPAAFKPENVLGRKGLLGKDRATRLALCAVKKALQDAGLLDHPLGETCGVIVSCSLGNLDTVCKVSQAIHEGHVRDLSVLDLPNASSNVIASNIAIRFACRALNLTLCGGSDGGTQAIHLARNAILANRATRMIVVGVEPRTDASESLLTQSLARWVGEAPQPPIEGAAALILETAPSAAQRQALVYGLLGSGGFLHSGSLEASVASAVDHRDEAPQ
jgi:3-oxoacyl-[acyl-carrier-protein] synthase II